MESVSAFRSSNGLSPGDSTTAETENSLVDTTYHRHGGPSDWQVGGA